MKNSLCLLSTLVFVLLSACGINAKEEVKYSIMNASWPVYEDAQELVENAKLVFVGKVKKISFQVLDRTTVQPPTDKTEDTDRKFYTMYDVDIDFIYKGKAPSPAQVRMMGGIRDYRVEEQLALMKKERSINDLFDGTYHISVWEEMPKFIIGETYLFVLHQYMDNSPTIMNLSQSIFLLENPFEKQDIQGRQIEENPEEYYDKNELNGGPILSARDIVLTFGQDKWDSFWTWWQKENPGWESRIDKKAVDKVLAQR